MARFTSTFILLAAVITAVNPVLGAPMAVPLKTLSTRQNSSSDFLQQNGLDAQKQNKQFATMTKDDSCQGMHI